MNRGAAVTAVAWWYQARPDRPSNPVGHSPAVSIRQAAGASPGDGYTPDTMR